jgi:AraC-like DNA-binding protein
MLEKEWPFYEGHRNELVEKYRDGMQMRQMTNEERRLKAIYEDGNQLLFSTPCSELEYVKWPCHSRIAKTLNFSMDKELGRFIGENRIIPAGSSVGIIQHPRYLPAIIHSHEFIKVVCVDKGNCSLIVDGKMNPLEAGDVAIIGPNIPQALAVFSDDVDVNNILMRSTTFKQSFVSLIAREDMISRFFMQALYDAQACPVVIFRCGEDNHINQIKQKLYQETQQNDVYSPRVQEAYLLLLFSLLLRFHENDIILIERISKPRDENILDCLKYIDSHLNTVTLGELSEQFLYNNTYLSRLIKSYTGFSFIEIVKKKRLEESKKMLQNTAIPIVDIVEKIGYTDLSHFYRNFKHEYGITPVEYRRKSNENK